MKFVMEIVYIKSSKMLEFRENRLSGSRTLLKGVNVNVNVLLTFVVSLGCSSVLCRTSAHGAVAFVSCAELGARKAALLLLA
jgi:hypothetical protein